jgi:hypothetical protein
MQVGRVIFPFCDEAAPEKGCPQQVVESAWRQAQHHVIRGHFLYRIAAHTELATE